MRNDDPIRLAYLIDTFSIGGTEINAVRTAECLLEAGFELNVFHIAADGPIRSRYAALGCPMTHLPIGNLYGAATFRQGRRLAASLRERQTDILQTHDVYTNIFGLPHARLGSGAVVVGARRWGRDVFPAKLNFLNRQACRFAHHVLANSRAVADLVARQDKVGQDRIFTVPNFRRRRTLRAGRR